MKIQKLSIEGFRSLKKVEWTPSDLNVVIGPNASGKSNLLAALELLAASARGKLGDYISDAGGLEPLVWDGQVEKILFDLNVAPVTGFMGADVVQYLSILTRYGQTNAYRMEERITASKQIDQVRIASEPSHLVRHDLTASIFDEKTTQAVITVEDVPAQETLLSQMTGSFAGNRDLVLFRKYLEAWDIYNDIYTDHGSEIRQSAITRFEKRLNSDGQNLATVLHTLYTNDRDFKREIDLGMRAAFDDYEEVVFLPSASQRIELGVRWKSLKNVQTAASLSDGTLRFLFLMTVLSSSELPPLIAIDEPEIGLHPRMMAIVAEYAANAARRTQIIFTTHSEAFLDAFRDTRPTTTVAKLENGETILNLVDEEELSYWLNDFTLGDIFRSGTLEHIA